MSDDSHTAYEPYPTAAMDQQHREDNVIRPELICTRKVYSEAAYKKLDDEYAKLWQMYGELEDKCDRLREVLEKIEVHPNAGFNVAIIERSAPTIAEMAHDALQEAGGVDYAEEVAKLETKCDRLLGALRDTIPVLEACDCFDDPTHNHCVRCKVLDNVRELLESSDDS